MADGSPYLAAGNARLAAALGLLALLGSTLALGPARIRIAELQAEIEERLERSRRWEIRQRGSPVSEAERQGWALQWQDLLERVPPDAGDPELVARLARALQRPSMRGLEIERLEPGPAAPEPLTLEVTSPLEGASLALEGVPVRVRFRARYEDLAHVLEDLEAQRLPARLESLDVRRAHPKVAVEMLLTLFSRRELGT